MTDSTQNSNTRTHGDRPTFTVSDRIRKARTVAGMTRPELAQALGCAQSTLIRLELGYGRPSRRDVLAVSAVTGVDAAWIAGDTVTA